MRARANRHYYSNFPEYSIILRWFLLLLFLFFRVFRTCAYGIYSVNRTNFTLSLSHQTHNQHENSCVCAQFIYFYIFSHVVVSKNIHRHFKGTNIFSEHSKMQSNDSSSISYIQTCIRGDNGSADDARHHSFHESCTRTQTHSRRHKVQEMIIRRRWWLWWWSTMSKNSKKNANEWAATVKTQQETIGLCVWFALVWTGFWLWKRVIRVRARNRCSNFQFRGAILASSSSFFASFLHFSLY